MGAPQVRRVSVIVPTCNRPGMLNEALASIRAIESPDLTFEILVGDNGNMAETRAIVAAHGAIHLKVERRGAGAARNVALMAATGNYLAFLDDDDVWLPTNIRSQLALLDQRPELEAVIGQVISTDHQLRPVADEPWPVEPPGEGDQLLRKMLSGFFPQIGTIVARGRVREMVGNFDETLLGGQDLDWMMRIARLRKLGFVRTPCIFFRGRPYGTYDALQLARIGFDRTVFFRHALPEWRIWRSPLDFSRAYTDTLRQFYQYFLDAAVERAERGERRRALAAIAGAFRVFPGRTTYNLVAPRPLRRAFLQIATPLRSAPAAGKQDVLSEHIGSPSSGAAPASEKDH